MDVTRRFVPVIGMGISAVGIVIAGGMFHVAPLFVSIGVLAVLLAGVYSWQGLKSGDAYNEPFWALIKASVVFVGGAVYGIGEVVREGWQWANFLILVVPTSLAAYLIWHALRLRRLSKPLTK
jgi:hypothetical protein